LKAFSLSLPYCCDQLRICLTVLLLCMGLVMGNIQPAFASNEAADAGQNQVEKGLDKVAGAGVAKQVG
jgi:hypothetical protein